MADRKRLPCNLMSQVAVIRQRLSLVKTRLVRGIESCRVCKISALLPLIVKKGCRLLRCLCRVFHVAVNGKDHRFPVFWNC